MGGVSAHAGLFGDTGDLAIFCQMLLNGGAYDHRRIVPAQHSWRSSLPGRTFPKAAAAPTGLGHAFEWKFRWRSLLSHSSFGHTGFTGTSAWIDPTRELFIILLTNRVHPSRENNAIREVRRLVADGVVKAVDIDPLIH